MYIKSKISLNFMVMSLLMIGIGAGYLFTSMYIQQKLGVISNGSLPSIQKLNQIREQIWNVWNLRKDEVDTGQAFRELEKNILLYEKVSSLEDAKKRGVQLRADTLDLQEAFDAENYVGFVEKVGEINQQVSDAMEKETAVLIKKGREVNGVVDYANSLSMAIIAVAILFCLLPGWWLASSINKALGNASRAADRIAQGDLSERMSEEGDDEITELASAFNRMVDTIRQADEEITREVEDRIRAERKAQIAAKAKSDFLAHMSHEFRTPLNGILGYSQLLSMDKGLSEKNLDVVKSLRKSGESLLELINDVLDLTKIEAQKMNVLKTRFYLGDFLESIVESYAEQVNLKGLGFEVKLDKDLPEDILSDQIRLRQILVNMLGNAIKFTDKGKVGIEVTPLDSGIRFSVFDTGIGIAQENHAAVMQPFQQIENRERKNQGTGLGLPISNRLLEMMGTHLNIKSALGEGTTFWFDLPQPDVKFRKLVHSPTRISGYRGKARKILIGEEGMGTASLLMPLMQKVGFEVLHLRTPETFLEKCQFFQPDVVLIDLYFEDASGVEVMQELQRVYDRDPETRMPGVFIFSDHRSPNDRERALRSGANAFLGVPIRFADLLVSLRDELDLVWIETGAGKEDDSAEKDQQEFQLKEETLPEIQSVHQLLECARSGNVRQLKEQLMALKNADTNLTPFVDRLLVLCGNYRINAIQQDLETLVLSLLEEGESNREEIS